MFRRAACLHSRNRITAGRGVVAKWPHTQCLQLQHSISTSLMPNFPCRSAREFPSQTLNSAAFFSSVPRLDVKESENNAIEATHAESKSQILKAERRRLNEENTNKSAKRKEFNRRKILAEELMRIFATNDECFNITLRELNVNKTNEYRQFYLDSLQSFGILLSDDDENILSQVGLSRAHAISILERFRGGGFSDPQAFSKKYRKMAVLLENEVELQSTLEQMRKDHEQKMAELRVKEPLLEVMESEQDRKKDEKMSPLGEKVASAKELLPSFKSSKKNCHEDELDRLEKELNAALSQVGELPQPKTTGEDLHNQRNKVNQAKAAAAKLADRISRLESDITEGVEWPMPRDEFQTVTENIIEIATSAAPALAKFITHRHDDFDKYRQMETKTDLTKPHDWYPHARLDKRKIIFHAGPTNSGKTYTALQRLKKAEKGMYLAPLRLLAAETYESLTAEGIYTDLITGQEHRKVPFSTHRSSTVELACIDKDYDVVVIDEIQMLGDEFRGFAWTRALLGVRCKEIHVCGGAEAIDIVKKICRMCGDDFELNTYKRFSDLRVLDNSLAESPTSKGGYQHVQPGDCVVAFSRNDIFAIKREIENSTPWKCCVIYGALPPGIRAEQARRFNDPNSEYEILVASDAIGMGLNLSIKRIVFNSVFKNNGERIVQLDHSSIKQIAGRAGRRNSPYPNGEVTCRDPNDMAHLKKCMGTEIQPLKKAGLIPTAGHIELFNHHLEKYGSSERGMGLHQTLRKFSEMATLQGDFFLCRKKSMEIVSKLLKDIDLSQGEKFLLCMSPVNESCMKSRNVFLRYLETYTSGKVPGLHYTMRPKPAKSFNHLSDLCSVHHQLELFLWLQTKLPSNAVEMMRAVTLKESTIDMINNGLLNAENLSLTHDYVSKDARMKKAWSMEQNRDE